MSINKRRAHSTIEEDLRSNKMVFISGPRQCGKTTLAKTFLEEADSYYNWDIDAQRRLLLKNEINTNAKLWVFDEIHKYRRWSNWLKGLYDDVGASKKIIVTGSAKLELFARGGDSLQGRYFRHRLHPLTVGELCASKLPLDDDFFETIFQIGSPVSSNGRDSLQQLLEFGGFPEPFLKANARFSTRWCSMYAERLVREDIRDLFRYQDLDLLSLLYARLPDTVSSSLNYKNLAKELQVADETVKGWILAFENLYGIFRVLPFGVAKIRAVKKEQKLYFWDWSNIKVPGARLENLVAVHLLRFCHWCEDNFGEKVELRYFRDVDGREVDFILIKNRQPWVVIEVKSSEQPIENALRYFVERVKVPFAFQLTLKSDQEYLPEKVGTTKIRKMPLAQFLAALP